jgi:hypothetical protein
VTGIGWADLAGLADGDALPSGGASAAPVEGKAAGDASGKEDADGQGDVDVASDELDDAFDWSSSDGRPANTSAEGDGEGDAEGGGLADGLELAAALLVFPFFQAGGLLACVRADG